MMPESEVTLLLLKFRKLIDKSSEPGTKILVWGTFLGLKIWSEMLLGLFNPGANTKWEVEPTPIVWFVTRRATGGPTVAALCAAIANLPFSRRA